MNILREDKGIAGFSRNFYLYLYIPIYLRYFVECKHANNTATNIVNDGDP